MINAILNRDNLADAWEQVRAKKGGPGIDSVTLARWGWNWEANIERLRHQVKTNTYRANRPKRFTVQKKGGGIRELSRLTITDKVLQRAMLNVIDPLFDPMFLSCSHGYRQGHSVGTAVEQVLDYRDMNCRWVLDADIEKCFDSINHGVLLHLVQQVTDDWFVLNLMAMWLKAGRKYKNQPVGIPMGAVISPLWANIYLHQLDRALSRQGLHIVRYADDFLILNLKKFQAHAAMQAVEEALTPLVLKLSAAKTRITCFDEGFTFLGVDFYKNTYSYTWEQKKITIKGKKLKMLYNHLPSFYNETQPSQKTKAKKKMKI